MDVDVDAVQTHQCRCGIADTVDEDCNMTIGGEITGNYLPLEKEEDDAMCRRYRQKIAR